MIHLKEKHKQILPLTHRLLPYPRKIPAKHSTHRYIIPLPTSNSDNWNLQLNINKYERSQQSKVDNAPSLSGREWLKVKTILNQTIANKTDSTFLKEWKQKSQIAQKKKKKKEKETQTLSINSTNTNQTRSSTLILWKCRGIRTNYKELDLLTSQNPKIIASKKHFSNERSH